VLLIKKARLIAILHIFQDTMINSHYERNEWVFRGALKSTTCGSDNGEILIHTLPSDDLMFRINDITYNNGQFLTLLAGHYTITCFGEFGCTSSVDITVPSENAIPL